MSKRTKNTRKYEWKKGNKILGYGITNDLEKREAEHKQEVPGSKLKIVEGKCSEKRAKEWGIEKIRIYKKRNGKLPPMNRPRKSKV